MKRLGRMGLVLGVLTLCGTLACRKEPDLATVHRVKGSEHLARKEWAKAVEEYELSLKADPKQEKVWEKKAFAHMQAGETDKAVAALTETMAFKAEPAHKAELNRSIASIYMNANDTEKAEQYFLEALKLEPRDEASLGWMAEIYSRRGGARSMVDPVVPEHLDKSLEYYDKVLELNPNSANTYLNKRIVTFKFLTSEQELLRVAQLEEQENARRKPAVAAEARARAEKHQARIEELKQQISELNAKFAEAQKAAKAQPPPQQQAQPQK